MPKILHSEIIAQTKIFKIERLELQFDNGITVQYERIVGSDQGAVLIVPLIDDQTVLLIREYAAGMGRYELALPKGNIEKTESIVEAANREIMEEVGYGANKLEHITSMSVSPGYLSHKTHVVVAQDLYEKRLTGDEPEPLEVIPWKLNDLEQLFQREDCTEARSIAALYMVRDKLTNIADK